MIRATTLLLLLLSTVAADHLEWKVSSSTLPKPLSDLGVAVDSNGLVYLSGGCDHPDGNVFVGNGSYACASISSSFYVFDAATGKTTTLPDLPQARYRHGSAATSNNQVWLIGGRNLTDSHILQVDVFDIASNTWSTVGVLPEERGTSDNAAWAVGEEVYSAGGYTAFYNASTTVLKLQAGSGNALSIQQLAPLLEARGDVKAVTDGTVAYVSGGFTHENGFCPSLDTVEKYIIGTNTWESLPPLQTGRGDKALTILDGKLYAMGGENQIQDGCQSNPQPGEQTIVVDDVEIFENGNWTVIASIPERRFRFEAVTIDNSIYTFGGQLPFDSSCMCYKTTDQILVYDDNHPKSHASVMSWVFAVVVASISLVIAY